VTDPAIPVPPPPQEDEERAEWLSYKVGGETDSGDKIIEILQRSPRYIVFTNQEGTLQWEFDGGVCIDGDASSASAMQLIAQVNISVLGKKRRRRMLGYIADSLANAFATRRADDTRDFFADTRAVVSATRIESLHVTYLAASTAAAIAVITVVAVLREAELNDDAEAFLLSIALAAVGALLSVLLRFRTIEVATYTSRLYTALGGISRIIAGGLFGAVFLLLHRAEFLLSIIKGWWAVAAASLLAGFSERLIPELLAAFETKLSANQLTNVPPPAAQTVRTEREPDGKEVSDG
jgi:hypothetical protein